MTQSTNPDDPQVGPWTVQSLCASDTDAFGCRLAAAAEPGLIVALIGDLGAGKTRLVRAAAAALGADPNTVNSPTFVLIQRYAARLPLFHFDAYRLRDAEEFTDLGPEDCFTAGGVCFVEWADRVTEALPEDVLTIALEHAGETERTLRITAAGSIAGRVLARWQALG